MNHAGEGVIKFHLTHVDIPTLPGEETVELRGWFPIFRQTGLLGQEPGRYEGYAWGNLSLRSKPGFIITCTQTSARQRLGPEHFSLVTGFNTKTNSLQSKGPCKPSSEAMSHGAIYQALPQVAAVFHVHSPDIWRQAEKLGLAVTDPAVEYGTPEMAACIETLLQRQDFSGELLFSMGGHEDGIIACADSPDRAATLLLRTLARAYQLAMNPALRS
ncbi:class II aldolase/adducin family protein [Thiolapillus sp.]